MEYIKTIGNCLPEHVIEKLMQPNSAVSHYLRDYGISKISDIPYEIVFGDEEIVDLGEFQFTLLPVVKHKETLQHLVLEGYQAKRGCGIDSLERRLTTNFKSKIIKDADYGPICDSYIHHYKSILGEEWSTEDFKNRISDLKYLTNKYAKDNKTGKTIVVGFFGSNIAKGAGGRYLTNAELYVLPQFRGRGIARELVRQSFTLAYTDGIQTFDSLTYRVPNHNPLDFWEKAGAETTELIHIAGDLSKMIERLESKKEKIEIVEPLAVRG